QSVAADPRLLSELHDLVAMQEQLAGPERIMIDVAAVRVGRDMAIVQERLTAVDPGEGVLEIRLAVAERLDLGAEEHETRLVPLADEIVVERLAVGRQHLLPRGPLPGTHQSFA